VAVSSVVVKEREHVKRRIVRSEHLYRVVVIVRLKDFFIFIFNIWCVKGKSQPSFEL